MKAERESVAVLGAGSFGTALANLLANNGQEVILWAHDPAHAEELDACARIGVIIRDIP